MEVSGVFEMVELPVWDAWDAWTEWEVGFEIMELTVADNPAMLKSEERWELGTTWGEVEATSEEVPDERGWELEVVAEVEVGVLDGPVTSGCWLGLTNEGGLGADGAEVEVGVLDAPVTSGGWLGSTTEGGIEADGAEVEAGVLDAPVTSGGWLGLTTEGGIEADGAGEESGAGSSVGDTVAFFFLRGRFSLGFLNSWFCGVLIFSSLSPSSSKPSSGLRWNNDSGLFKFRRGKGW